MAISNPETIQIDAEDIDGQPGLVLRVDGCRRALVTKRQGRVELHWLVHGPMVWPEAKVLLQGLLQLSIQADAMAKAIKKEKQ